MDFGAIDWSQTLGTSGHIRTHVADAQSRLTSQFQRPNLLALVGALVQGYQDIEDALWSIITGRPFPNAVGDALSWWGQAAGMPRPSSGAGSYFDSYAVTPSGGQYGGGQLSAGNVTAIALTASSIVNGIVTSVSVAPSSSSTSWSDIAQLIAAQPGILAATAPSFTATKTTDNAGCSIVSCAGSATVGTVAGSYPLTLSWSNPGGTTTVLPYSVDVANGTGALTEALGGTIYSCTGTDLNIYETPVGGSPTLLMTATLAMTQVNAVRFDPTSGNLFYVGSNSSSAAILVSVNLLSKAETLIASVANAAAYQLDIAKGAAGIVDGTVFFSVVFGNNSYALYQAVPGSPYALTEVTTALTLSQVHCTVAVNPQNGHVYVQGAAGSYWVYDVYGGTVSQISTGLAAPGAVTCDPSGNLYVGYGDQVLFYPYANGALGAYSTWNIPVATGDQVQNACWSSRLGSVLYLSSLSGHDPYVVAGPGADNFQWTWGTATSSVFPGWPTNQEISLDGGNDGVLTFAVDATEPSSVTPYASPVSDAVTVVQNGTALEIQVKPGYQVELSLATTGGSNQPSWSAVMTTDDSAYHAAVQAQIIANTSPGTSNTLIDILKNLGATSVSYSEPGQYGVQAAYGGTLTVSGSQVAAMLTAAAPPVSLSLLQEGNTPVFRCDTAGAGCDAGYLTSVIL